MSVLPNNDTLHIDLLVRLDALATPLSTMALLSLADEFYSKDERSRLYAKYETLKQNDKDADAELRVVIEAFGSEMSWEQRVSVYGEDIAMDLRVSRRRTSDAKTASRDSLRAFETAYPIISRLMQIKERCLSF